MPLDQYRKKRRFGVTLEPPGKPQKPRARKLAYVIQKSEFRGLA